MKSNQRLTGSLSGAWVNIRRCAWVFVGSGIIVFSSGALAQYEATAYGNGSVIGYTTIPGDISYAFDDGNGMCAPQQGDHPSPHVYQLCGIDPSTVPPRAA